MRTQNGTIGAYSVKRRHICAQKKKNDSTCERPCGAVYLDCLDGILDLKQTALGREGVDAAIVLGPAGAENSRKEEREIPSKDKQG